LTNIDGLSGITSISGTLIIGDFFANQTLTSSVMVCCYR